MGTEIVKSEDCVPLAMVGSGPISLDGLTPAQQNELRMLAAKKGIDLAGEAATMKLRLQAAAAEVDVALNAAKQLSTIGTRVSIESTSTTATGNIKIKAKKGLIV